MKIIIQDNAHPILFLLDEFKRPLKAEPMFRAQTHDLEDGQDVIVSRMKFRLSEVTGNWRFIVTDGYPRALDRSEERGRLLQKAEGGVIALKEQWKLGIVRGGAIVAARDSLGDEFTCCSGLMGCIRAMGIDVEPADFSHRPGTDYSFE